MAHSGLEVTGGLVGGIGVWIEAGGEAFEQRVEGGEEFVGGQPPNSFAQRALWPAAQTPLRMSAALRPPVSRKGIQSQCSTQE